MDHFVVLLVPFNESLASGFNQPTTAILIHPFNSRVRSGNREPAVLHAGHGALGPWKLWSSGQRAHLCLGYNGFVAFREL